MPTSTFQNSVSVKLHHKDLFSKIQWWEMLLDKQLSFVSELQGNRDGEETCILKET